MIGNITTRKLHKRVVDPEIISIAIIFWNMYSTIFLCLTFVYYAASVCVDLTNPTTGVSDCSSRAYLCNNSLYYTLMTQQCPATCGRCSTSTSTGTSTSCVDLTNLSTGVSDCSSKAYLCNNSLYYTLMTQQCPATCGRCSTSTSTGTSTSCVDLTNPSTGVSDCSSRAYLCNNSLYYTLMTQQCPRTCGRCTTGKK
uniref:ShKT domain-containing protein n=1 Tax=Acrobeloides nanus TaxID=290746 RepID=A0A914END3_9BILA